MLVSSAPENQELTYLQKTLNGYSYLRKEVSEILLHQIAFDTIQDILIKEGFKFMMQYGNQIGKVNIHPTTGLHKLMHDILGHDLAHSLAIEFAMHAAIKISVTAAFPLIYSLDFMSIVPQYARDNIIDPSIKFMGIQPLEIFNVIKVIPNKLFGSNNSISNTIDYLTLHENHYYDRAGDPQYEQFTNDYNNFMESVDAVIHATDDLSVLYNNINLPGAYKKALTWFQVKLNLYFNSEKFNQDHNDKIHDLRQQNFSDEDSLIHKSYGEYSYNDALEFIKFNVPYAIAMATLCAYENFYHLESIEQSVALIGGEAINALENQPNIVAEMELIEAAEQTVPLIGSEAINAIANQLNLVLTESKVVEAVENVLPEVKEVVLQQIGQYVEDLVTNNAPRRILSLENDQEVSEYDDNSSTPGFGWTSGSGGTTGSWWTSGSGGASCSKPCCNDQNSGGTTATFSDNTLSGEDYNNNF